MGQVKHRIVIVDDDQVGRQIAQCILAEAGYDAVAVARGSHDYQQVISRETDLVILEVGLPDIDGVARCTQLRARHYTGPVIFLTSRTDIASTIRGCYIGADDCIVKPYEPLELVHRVQAVICRFNDQDQQARGTIVHVGDAVLSVAQGTYSSSVVPTAPLTPTELKLLECLMRNSCITMSHDTLIRRVWGDDVVGDSNRIDVYIRRVRHKVEADPAEPRYLHTVRGLGYVFRVEPG